MDKYRKSNRVRYLEVWILPALMATLFMLFYIFAIYPIAQQDLGADPTLISVIYNSLILFRGPLALMASVALALSSVVAFCVFVSNFPDKAGPRQKAIANLFQRFVWAWLAASFAIVAGPLRCQFKTGCMLSFDSWTTSATIVLVAFAANWVWLRIRDRMTG